MDVAVSSLGLAVLSPVMGVTALAVWADSGRPVIFRQRRIGRDGVPFTIFKFRSMRPPAPGREGPRQPQAGCPREAAERMTRVGRFLRRWAIDELPQLLNVLRGEMSLVGPRPLIPEHDRLLRRDQEARRSINPGMTGWAAVTGGGAGSWEQRVDKDLYYLENASLWMDAAIILLSGPAIAGYGEPHSGRGRTPGNHASGSPERDPR